MDTFERIRNLLWEVEGKLDSLYGELCEEEESSSDQELDAAAEVYGLYRRVLEAEEAVRRMRDQHKRVQFEERVLG